MSILSSLTPDFGMHWDLSSTPPVLSKLRKQQLKFDSSAQVHRGKKALTFCVHLCVLIFALILAYQCHTILSDLSFLFIQPFLVFSRWTFSNHCNITKNETKAYVFTLFYCHIILLMQSQFLPAPAK